MRDVVSRRRAPAQEHGERAAASVRHDLVLAAAVDRPARDVPAGDPCAHVLPWSSEKAAYERTYS